MGLRPTLIRIGVISAGGALAVLAASGAALAGDDWGDPRPDHHGQDGRHHDDDHGQGDGRDQDPGPGPDDGYEQDGGNGHDGGREHDSGNGHDGGREHDSGNGHDGGREHHHTTKGRVTAHGGLLLRTAPDRGSEVLRVAEHGEIVHIFCKAKGERVHGDKHWYLLTDGTWAWGSARYIDTLGEKPRWC
ncbi:SH3 domain-containing protein [Streptomyces poonensis]|uniref:SH3 domain-containing protein n=1 Tax=Streptomyces poonensis TaxID=68255 RepID=A0A918P7V6_9ACTN|nr:SH3 domain-containing protein [Streptomyces poonensis]GGY88779.1 hypothetical protein GCM10010365_03560 [Streptomyces poonensis]GLJ92414.1 hypothetical protein GCM10017589_50230 [Streptomyces poonensis]